VKDKSLVCSLNKYQAGQTSRTAQLDATEKVVGIRWFKKKLLSLFREQSRQNVKRRRSDTSCMQCGAYELESSHKNKTASV